MAREVTWPRRRTVLKSTAGIGAIGLSGLAGCLSTDEETIGNYPPDGDEVVYGFNGPLTGGLAPDGDDQLQGFRLAIDHLNNGGGLVDEIDLLTGDGVLDYEVDHEEADSGGDADTAIDNFERMVDRDNIQFLGGGMSSAVTMALQPEAQRHKVPFIGGNSTSSGISGENCSRYYFHPSFHAEIIGMAAGDLLPDVLGDDRELFHIYMDYSYGQSNRDAVRDHLTTEGDGPWEDLGGAAIAEDETDHSSQISDLDDSGADVLHFASFGEFAASGLSQMRDAGVLEDVDVFIPHVSEFTLDPLGTDAEGVYGMEPWNPYIDNEMTEIFVEAYEDEYDTTPTQSSYHTYDCVLHYSAAVEENESFFPPDVVRTLEEFEWEYSWGSCRYRECDHQVERPWFLVEGVGDDRAEELGVRTEVIEQTDPLIYDCDSYPGNECDMDGNEYGDE